MAAVHSLSGLALARLWHHVDASGGVVGRLAVEIARLLQGKHKPIFTSSNDCGDYVVVTNAGQMQFSGKKLEQKSFYYHTQYPGGLRRTRLCDLNQSDPAQVLRKAVYGMLPRNKLRVRRMSRLKIFAMNTTPYEQNFERSYDRIMQRGD